MSTLEAAPPEPVAVDQEAVRRRALNRLAALVGEWTMEVDLPGSPTGRVSFEWMLNEQFLVQRSHGADPVPDSLAIIAVAPDGDGFVQHYFDMRGVVRTYAMTLDEHTWTLRRDTADFSPLDFAQRFAGTIASDGSMITAAWEARDPGDDWRVDFPLRYRRESQ